MKNYDSTRYLRMVRVPDRGTARLDLFQLIGGYLIAAVLLMALPGWAHAAGYSTAQIGGGASKAVGGTWSVQGAAASAANGKFYTPGTVNAAGKQVTMPASATFAANAATFAVGAVRLNPAGLFFGAVLPWLLVDGLQWADNQWTKTSSPGADPSGMSGYYWRNATNGSTNYSSAGAACQAYCSNASIHASTCVTGSTVSGPATAGWATGKMVTSCTASGRGSGYSVMYEVVARWPSCLSGYTMTNNVCVPNQQTVPATEADFDVVEAKPLPDAVAQQLAQAGVPIPVAAPVLDPAPKVEDYGIPFVDPVTGKTVQTKTRLTPSPTVEDPYNVRQESYNVEVSPAPTPDPADPVPLPEAEQPKDPCLDNPGRLGCMEGGTPDDTELQTQTPNFTVSPVTIGGAGDCPADTVLSVQGISVTMKLGAICDAAGWLRPLVLALAWFSAALIIGGAVRGES